MKKIILNAFGKDKPGIVSKISGIIHSFSGNIEISKMIQLESDFTLIMLIKIQKNNIKNLFKKLDDIEGLEVITKITEEKTTLNKNKEYSFNINVIDNEGLVYIFSNLLKKYAINIIAMDTFIKNAPITGSPIFYLESKIKINEKINLEKFKSELIELADNNNVEFKFKII